MIHMINAKDYISLPVMKSYFNLSDADIHALISEMHKLLLQQLDIKHISYDSLKSALIPNQDKTKFEICLVFDSTQISANDYGYFIFNNLIPLLNRENTCSILCGDFIDTHNGKNNSQQTLQIALKEVLTEINPSRFEYSSQYYLIYFNRLTNNQKAFIVDSLSAHPWFVGFADITHQSFFKSYISNILVHSYVKCGSDIIAPHPSDYLDTENINMRGFPFEKYGYNFISINEESFGPFLSYKIESLLKDADDVGFSFNALFPKFDSIEKIQLKIDDKKWNEYLFKDTPGKRKILESLGYCVNDKKAFINEIYKKICSSYIYNLNIDKEHDVLKFNVCLDLITSNQNLRKTTIALKYFPESGEMSVITIT